MDSLTLEPNPADSLASDSQETYRLLFQDRRYCSSVYAMADTAKEIRFRVESALLVLKQAQELKDENKKLLERILELEHELRDLDDKNHVLRLFIKKQEENEGNP